MEIKAIGIVHSPFQHAQGTPIQPYCAEGTEATVEVFEPFAEGLADLDGFERIWLLFWCHLASEPRLQVIPYRDTEPHGLFSTRAPARPNPIGMSAVRLLSVENRLLRVAEIDILDGTPLLDIKPYVPQYDSLCTARCGWLETSRTSATVRSADGRFEAP